MNKDYEINGKKQKKALSKYRKALIKIVVGVVLGAVGFSVAGSLLADFFIKIVFDSEIAVLLSVLSKAALMGGGALVSIINVIKARLAKKEIDHLEDEEEEIVQYIEKEKMDQTEKVQSLEKEIKNVKANDKEKTMEIDNSKIASINNKIENRFEYGEEEHKTKRR